MKRNLLIILVCIILITILSLIILFLLGETNKKKLEIDNYIIHYYNNYSYDIETKTDGIYVKIHEEVNCITYPCPQIIIDSFKVEYKDEYKEFIENIFKNKDTKIITITNSDLTDKEVKIISNIVNRNYDKNI